MEIRDLVAFDKTQVDRMFDAAGLAPPVILFDPSVSALRNARLRQFAGLCDRLTDMPGGAIRREDFRMEAFGNMADFVFAAEREAGARQDEWLFSYSGRDVDACFAKRLFGTSVDDLAPSAAGLFTVSWAHSVHLGGKRVMTEHRVTPIAIPAILRTLCVPITSPGPGLRRITDGFVCYAAPEDPLSIGLDAAPDPTLVVDDANRVRFANRAARELFNGGRGAGAVLSELTEYTQSDLVLFGRPGAARRAGRRLRQACRCLVNRQIIEMDAVVGTTAYNDEDFYVITMRPKL